MWQLCHAKYRNYENSIVKDWLKEPCSYYPDYHLISDYYSTERFAETLFFLYLGTFRFLK